MPRRNRPKTSRSRTSAAAPATAGARPLTTNQRVESFRGVDYLVRTLAGSSTAGPYRCPGCEQLLPGTLPHVVAWPEHDGDASDRRHWHTACWAGRGRRAPVTERSRNAPRYS